MDEIKINTDSSLDDYVKFNLFALEKYHKISLQYNLLIITCILSFGIAFIIEEKVLFMLLGTFSLAYRIFHPIFVKRLIKKQVKDSPSIISSSELTINEDEIMEVSETTTTKVKWKNIFSFDEDNELIYIFHTKIQAFIIQKRNLNDQALYHLQKWSKAEKNDSQ